LAQGRRLQLDSEPARLLLLLQERKKLLVQAIPRQMVLHLQMMMLQPSKKQKQKQKQIR